jgi:S-adenosylmethionine:tRNA ribosyltransferase-isomerase
LTLHVGAGTFLPVKSERMADHAMHGEQVRVPLAPWRRIRADWGKGPIVPWAPPHCSTLESIYWHGVMLLQGRAGAEMAIDQWEPYGARCRPSRCRTGLDAVIQQVKYLLTSAWWATELLIAPGYTFVLRPMRWSPISTSHKARCSCWWPLSSVPIGGSVYEHALWSMDTGS